MDGIGQVMSLPCFLLFGIATPFKLCYYSMVSGCKVQDHEQDDHRQTGCADRRTHQGETEGSVMTTEHTYQLAKGRERLWYCISARPGIQS